MIDSVKNIKRNALFLFSITACCLVSCAGSYQNATLDFPVISSDLPYDVDVDALRSLSDTPNKTEPPFSIPDSNLAAAQRWFDIFSWQTFIALNWPAQANGLPSQKKDISDSVAPRVWEYYTDIEEVFQKDGQAPASWNAAVAAGQNKTFWLHGLGFGTPADTENAKDGGYRLPVLDESIQAFTGPLVDQQGKWVRYQVLMNQTEFDYVVDNKLYSLEGQAEFTAKNSIQFPENAGLEQHGSMEIKLSWKQLNAVDDRTRFFVREAKVMPLTGDPFTAEFGLVGMHVSVRTKSSPVWIWATFEHVDNTAVNELETNSMGQHLRPTFFNIDNPTIPVNIMPAKNAVPVAQYNPTTGKHDGPTDYTSWDESLTKDPTQVIMVLPVPKATAALNAQVQGLLASIGSVFQYYELIGTQWPTNPQFPSFSNGVTNQSDGRLLPSSPESILYKIPGKLVPVHLVNTTMETFFQNGNQQAGPLAYDDRLPAGIVADPNIVFATESCVGCHFSAGACIGFKKDPYGRYLVREQDGKKYRVPIFGQNAVQGRTGDADYSWLLQLRAQSAPYAGDDTAPLESALIPNL
jgi:hypothetical protein